MTLAERISAFSSLGKTLRDALSGESGIYTTTLTQIIENQHLKNPWFTSDNVRMALNSIARELTEENLERWTRDYSGLNNPGKPFRTAVIMAGNIPLVGFHDFLSVLISGNTAIVKRSSKDPELILFIRDLLTGNNKEFNNRIIIAESILPEFDAVIATGSDNTSRYFEQYFGKYPHIIRKNRNSIAILDGTESRGELEALGTDIFSYFGLGCRSVSKIFIPEGYDLSALTAAWGKFSDLGRHSKYANNYDYNKAVSLVNRQKFTDTGFLLLKEDMQVSSPVAVLHTEYYRSREELQMTLNLLKDKLQCIVGRDYLRFGNAQSPALWDYADGIDTLEFLLKKNRAGIL